MIPLVSFFTKLPWQIWAALVVLLVLGVAGRVIDQNAYNRGFSAADTQWLEAVAIERERVATANEKAADLAAKEVARLNEVKEVRDATIQRLTREAAKDANAGSIALGVDGVRRLNQLSQ